MKFMICLKGDSEQHPFMSRITGLSVGIEVQSYGLKGIVSDAVWQERLSLHQSMLEGFNGDLAVHGPFIGMKFSHIDHLIDAAINKRMDMIYDVVRTLNARTLVLHTGYSADLEIFGLEGEWLEQTTEFWKREITRWSDINVTVVLENVVETSPDTMVRLADAIGHPALGLCLDVGHQYMRSTLNAGAWIERMGKRLRHVHLHDNRGKKDEHLPVGRGSMDFLPIFKALRQHAPEAVVSLEVDSDIETKVKNLEEVIERYK